MALETLAEERERDRFPSLILTPHNNWWERTSENCFLWLGKSAFLERKGHGYKYGCMKYVFPVRRYSIGGKGLGAGPRNCKEPSFFLSLSSSWLHLSFRLSLDVQFAKRERRQRNIVCKPILTLSCTYCAVALLHHLCRAWQPRIFLSPRRQTCQFCLLFLNIAKYFLESYIPST